MISLPVFQPLQADMVRAQLKHSWLENQILNKSPGDVVDLWHRGAWEALQIEFPHRLDLATGLANTIEEGFSPAQLVDLLKPFAELSRELKAEIRLAVHRAYLLASGIAALKPSLSKAVDALRAELEVLNSVWNLPKSVEAEELVRRVWEQLLERAHGLREILEQLPKGIWLP